MKKLIVVFSILFSTLFIVPTSAHADGCDASNPCGTYSVLDTSGTVTNTIVCTAAVCGGGTFGGNTVVLQVPPNPNTGQTQGGYNSSLNNPVTYNSYNNVFTVGSSSSSNPVVNSQTVVDNQVVTTLSAKINYAQKSFTPTNLINGNVVLTPILTANTGAQIFVSTIDGTNCTQESTSCVVISQENALFNSPQTAEQVSKQLFEANLANLNKNIDALIKLLGNWIIK